MAGYWDLLKSSSGCYIVYNLVFVCLKYITIEQEVFLHMPGAELQKARGGTSLPLEMCVLSFTWRWGWVGGGNQWLATRTAAWWEGSPGGQERWKQGGQIKAVGYGTVLWNRLTYCLIRKFGLSPGGWISYNDLSVCRQQEKEILKKHRFCVEFNNWFPW